MPYVEPSEKVRRAILAAIEGVGIESFLQEVNIPREEVEKWVKGEGWVPLRAVAVACTLGRGRLGALVRVSEVIEGLDVVAEPPPERVFRGAAQPVEAPSRASIQKERGAEGKAEDLKKRVERSRTFSRLLIRSTVLVMVMLVSSLAGYVVGSRFGVLYAGLGLFLPLIAGLLLALIWSLRTKPPSA